MQTYVYPTSVELMTIDQKLLPVLELSDPIFKHFPVRGHDSALVQWEQEDDYLGMMQMRGYEGEFPFVPGTGTNRYSMDPGIYGEGDPILELELTTRRGFGDISRPVEISDLVMKRQRKLMTRQYNRMSWVLWTLMATGIYRVLGPTGAILKQDSYAPQTYTSSVAWATIATATPLADFRGVTALHRGSSVSFGSTATAYMNLVTFNRMIANTNVNDLGGRRSTGLSTVEGIAEFNALAMKDNLPQIQIWDEGYKSDGFTDTLTAGTFTPFLPDGVVVILGRRLNGAPLGEFMMTRNVNNPDAGSGVFVKVIDTGAIEGARPPRRIEVFRGMNGGPAVYYPGSIVVMTVS